MRFAKTIGNKLQRRYGQMAHVTGKPFMLAVADFHAPTSMLWSREGLMGYLYGMGAELAEEGGRPVARTTTATHLQGPSAFPAELFANADHAELSAVIFSNACAISKLNRVMMSAGAQAKGLRYTRIGRFFDRRPGALEGEPFCLDVTSPQYRQLWFQGYEPWSAEMEVFHNPFTRHPAPHDLLPEATHWFGSKLWSQTYIRRTRRASTSCVRTIWASAALLRQCRGDPGGAPSTNHSNDDTYAEFTLRISASYRFAPELTGYVSCERGFKSGGFNMRGDAALILTPSTAASRSWSIPMRSV